MHLVLTDCDGRYLSDGGVASGDFAKVDARFRRLIALALGRMAAGMVLVHNHTSGDPTPSASDIASTRSLAAIARILDIEIVDHIVVGWQSACSFRKAGLL